MMFNLSVANDFVETPDMIADPEASAAKRWYLGTQSPRAKFYSRSHNAVIRVYDDAGNVIETHKHAGDFKEC
jgi:hypothetical protein